MPWATFLPINMHTDLPRRRISSPIDLLTAVVVNQTGHVKRRLTAVALALVGLIALADFLLGFEISLLAFYFVPVAIAVVARGWKFATLIAVVCTVLWISGDIAAGARYSSRLIPVWNAGIALITFLVIIWLLAGMLRLQRDLELRVERRTAALANEVAERERLEKAVLEISDRERRTIGHDLHDGLGQHLTGTAITGQILAERLQERAAEETNEARKLVGLIKAGIEQTRQMAKGLLLADIDANGLTSALREFCSNTSEQFRMDCVFVGETRVLQCENGVANHMYRIAQEAVRNAIRHGGAKRIDVSLRIEQEMLTLSVSDDGSGLPPPETRRPGLGLRIMEHRARIIGATFAIETPPEGGTLVVCKLPRPA